MVEDCHTAWSAMGGVDYKRKASEEANVQFRRSLYVVEDVAVGEILTESNLRSIRPGFGLAPRYFDRVVGLRAKRVLKRGTPLDLSYIEWSENSTK